HVAFTKGQIRVDRALDTHMVGGVRICDRQDGDLPIRAPGDRLDRVFTQWIRIIAFAQNYLVASGELQAVTGYNRDSPAIRTGGSDRSADQSAFARPEPVPFDLVPVKLAAAVLGVGFHLQIA